MTEPGGGASGRSAGPSSGGELRRYYVLRTIGSLGNQMLQFLVPVVVYTITSSVVWAGMALVVEWVPRLASLLVAGPLVDRFGVRVVYLTSEVLRFGASVVVVLTLLFSPGAGPWGMIVLALVAGACFEQTFIAGEKAVRLLAPPEHMHRAQSVLGGIEQATLLAAPALGGAVLLLGTATTIMVTGGLFGISAVLARGLPQFGAARGEASEELRGLATRMRTSIGWVARSPILRDIVLITMLINLMLGTVIVASPVFLVGRFHLAESYLGLVYTAAGVASLAAVATVPVLVRRFGLLRMGVTAALAACAAFTMFGIAPQAMLFAAMVTAFMATESVFTVFIRTVRARIVPPTLFGSVVGVVVLLNFLPMPLAGAVVAASRLVGPLWLTVAGVGLLCGLGCAIVLRHLAALMPQHRDRSGNWSIPALATATATHPPRTTAQRAAGPAD